MSQPLRPLTWRASALALGLALAAGPGLAAGDHASGDGSNADNERLQPGIYPADPVLDSGDWLREPYHPFFDVDWSVSLRGTYAKATAGERLDTWLVPTITLTHEGVRSSAVVDASAEIVRPQDGQIDVGALRLGLDGTYELDSVTTVALGGDFSFTQAIAGTPGLAADVAIAPETFSGSGSLGVTRQFGKFNLGLTGAIARNVYGPTTLTNGSVVQNHEQNVTLLDGSLRLGLQATPILEVFGVASLGRDLFDNPSSTLLVKPDATDMTLRGGVTGRWNDILEASVSAGLGWRRFDAASLDEVRTQLYDASVTFTPDPTWRLTAGLSTTVTPSGPQSPGTTRVEYAANAEAAYTVNSWLALRAMADWSTASFTGSTNTETGYGWGAGADYKVNAHTAITADYGYDHATSTANGVQEAHRVTVGITLSR